MILRMFFVCLIAGSFTHVIDTSHVIDGIIISLTIEGFIDSIGPIISVFATACSSDFDSCVSKSKLFKDLRLGSQEPCVEGIINALSAILHAFKYV